MKGLLIASSIGLVLASGSAFAADLPAPAVGASVPPPPVYTWTGCYINGGAGYGMWKQDHYGEELTPLTQLTPTVSTGAEGWVGTVGAGCDYQAGSRWLIGAFGDYNLMSVVYGGSFQEPYWRWLGAESEQSAWAVGGRVGYLVTPKLLAYINAGYTQARFGQIIAPAACGAGPCFIPAHTDGGWFIGGGTEYALWDIIPVHGLFWRFDYRYAVYNSADLPILTSTGAPLTLTCTGIGAAACGEHMQKDVQTFTTGLVWRFNVDGSPSGSAFAADLPATDAPAVRASAPPPPVYTWTGCYINGGAGYGMFEQDEYRWSSSMATGATGGEGWLGTVGVGCDYQVGSRVVIGVLADYDFMNLSGYFRDPFLGYTAKETGTEVWAVGARLGYLVTPKLLAYINAGYAPTHFDQINFPSTPYYYPAHTNFGACCFLGAGTEYALGDIIPLKGLFWRIEYRYVENGEATLPLLTTTGHSTGASIQLNKDVQTVTSGFVLRFNFSGP
ncbi:MAG: outer membrane beta-barrel protein [Candidatus Acidiferrales bacterium]|jgi:outer membrane immunogenic protein